MTRIFVTILSLAIAASAAAANEGLIKAGDQSYRARDYAKAIEHYSAALDDPSLTQERRADVHYARGLAYRQLPNREAALDDFLKVVELAPKRLAGPINAGEEYLSLNRPEAAKAMFEAALRLTNQSWAVYKGLAVANLDLNLNEEGLRNAELGLALTTTIPQLWAYRAIALHRLRRIDDAIASYRAGLMFNPKWEYGSRKLEELRAD